MVDTFESLGQTLIKDDIMNEITPAQVRVIPTFTLGYIRGLVCRFGFSHAQGDNRRTCRCKV